MQNFKKLLCACLACAMLPSAAVFAEASGNDANLSAPIQAEIRLFDDDGGDNTTGVKPPTDEESEFIKIVAEGIRSHEEEINIPEEYAVTLDRFEELFVAFTGHYMQLECPDIIDMPSVQVQTSNGRIDTVFCEYFKTDEEYSEAQMAIYCELDKITGLLSDDMTELEKVLCVHDYIAANYEYDMRVYSDDEGDLSSVSRDLDTMIMEKMGVCEGYTKLFKFVMDNIGIECVSVPSEECAHIWNKVKISNEADGEKKWYNIDVTSDDATPNMSGYIFHTYFLLNDEELIKSEEDTEENHRIHRVWNEFKWDGKTPCEVSDGTEFSDLAVRSVMGQLAYKNGVWYGFNTPALVDNRKPADYNVLCAVDVNGGTFEELYTASSEFAWKPRGGKEGSIYIYPSSLTLFAGEIYFNSPSGIYKFDTESKTAENIYDYEKENPDKKDASATYLYGIRPCDDMLYAEFSTDIDNGIEDLIPILQITNPCSYNCAMSADGDIELTFSMPYKYQKASNIFIAQYSGNGFIGIAQGEQTENKLMFKPDELCEKFKVLIWDKKTNEPYSPAEDMVLSAGN